MRKRKSNKGALIAVIASLSVVSVVSVGFASWLITGGDTATADGQISVESVDDSRFHIYKAESPSSNGISKPEVTYYDASSTSWKTAAAGGKLSFGPKADGLTAGWLHSSASGNSIEQLKAKVTYWVANLSGKTMGTGYDLSATIATNGDSTANTAFNTAVTGTLLAWPTLTTNSSVFNVTSTTATLEADGLTYTKVELDLTFKWGSYFGTNSDPAAFYNGKTITAKLPDSEVTYGDDALDKLGKIEAANGATFRVNLTTSPHVAS